LTNKLKGDGLYIFDEPEAALSPNRQLAALAAIHHLVKKGFAIYHRYTFAHITGIPEYPYFTVR
jgi:predicted ATPase